MKLQENEKISTTARRMLDAEFCPVIIYPRDFPRAGGRTLGKEPFGKAWGEKEVTFDTIDNDISYFDQQDFVAGVGILLGPGRAPGGRALADLDGDGIMAEDSFARLFKGEVVESVGHYSERGRHLFLAYDFDRVRAILGRLDPYQGKGSQSGVYHLPGLPDLELRLGGYHKNGKVKQLQTVIPPTPGTGGQPRRWNGVFVLADAPEAFYRTLEEVALEAAVRRPVHGTGADRGHAGDAVERYLRAALERTVGRIATAPVSERHAALMSQATSLARYIHYGRGFTEAELEAAILAGANQAAPERDATGENLRCTREAIAFGKTIPKELPADLHAMATGRAPERPEGWAGDKVDFDDPDPARGGAAHANGAAGPRQARQAPAKDKRPDYADMTDEELGITYANTIVPQAITWLWKYRLQRGAMALLTGMAGVGKSQVLLGVAAIVTRGDPWPDSTPGDPQVAQQGKVVILSAEDHPRQTIVPRLMAAGADMTRVVIQKAQHVIKAVRPGDPDYVHPKSLQDVDYWHHVFARIGDVRLFIVDPLPSFLGKGINDAKNIELRQVIEPFIHAIVEPFEMCFLCNTHFNKSVDIKSATHKISGSHAYGDLPRNAHAALRDPDDKSKKYFKQIKCNNAPEDLGAIAFTIERADQALADGEVIETTKATFDATGLHDIDADEMMQRVKEKKTKPGPPPRQTNACAVWLHAYLTEHPGPQHFGDVINAAGEAGFAGTYDEEKNRWSNPGTLYNAKKAVPKLDPPLDGCEVVDCKLPVGRRGTLAVHWELARQWPGGHGGEEARGGPAPGDDDAW